MKRKNWTTRMISGLLSAVMVLSAAVTPMTAFASELIPEEELKAYVDALPELDQVKDILDADEIVTAKDLDVEFGADIDLKKDFTNIEIPDKEKVNVKFYEAKDADKADFSTGKAGTYKAVYYVEPANEQHPVYRISRNITVKEPVTEAQTEGQSSDGGDESEESGDAEDSEADPEPQPQAVMAPETEAAEIPEMAAPESVFETEESHIIYEFTEEAYELEMAAAQETAQATEEAETSSAAIEETVPETADAERTAQTEEVMTSQEESVTPVAETNEQETAGESEGTAEPEETDVPAETTESAETGSSEEAKPEEETKPEEAETTAEETEAASTAEDPAMIVISPEEMDEMLEEAETQDTYDEESGWTVSGVIQWATEEEEIDLAALGFGETVSFEVPRLRGAKAASTQTVDVTCGTCYQYEDYGLGTYQTHKYTVKFGSVSATAYCVQPSRGVPGDGTFKITKKLWKTVNSSLKYTETSDSAACAFP